MPRTQCSMLNLMAARRWIWIGLVLALTAAASAADHDRARIEVERGRVLSLAELLGRLPPKFAGQVLEAELEGDEERWIYEIELLLSDGRVVELELDARTGELIRVEGED